MIYADVIIDISHEKLDRSISLSVCRKKLEGQIQAGMVVSVPFGNGRSSFEKDMLSGLSGEADFQRETGSRLDPGTVK